MNWKSLYNMQKNLDLYIETQHNLEKGEKIEEKILALLVEVGELANETRCFKFWSMKEPSDKTVILEEYVDGVHFLLSIGLDLDLDYISTSVDACSSQTEAFLNVYDTVRKFRQEKGERTYREAFYAYLQLGLTLGITEEELVEAYKRKNAINYERQDQGY